VVASTNAEEIVVEHVADTPGSAPLENIVSEVQEKLDCSEREAKLIVFDAITEGTIGESERFEGCYVLKDDTPFLE